MGVCVGPCWWGLVRGPSVWAMEKHVFEQRPLVDGVAVEELSPEVAAAWAEVETEGEDAQRWREVFGRLFPGDAEVTFAVRADALQAHGWLPSALEELCGNPWLIGSFDRAWMFVEPGDLVVAQAALLREVAAFFDRGGKLVSLAAEQLVLKLLERGMSQALVGEMVGWSRQRVWALAQGGRVVL